MTQDTECFRYVTCVRVLSRVRAKFILGYNCKIFTFFFGLVNIICIFAL